MLTTPKANHNLPSEFERLQSLHNHIHKDSWFRGIESLLGESEGIQLFHDYLLSTHASEHLLDFWFACKGFRSHADLENPDKIFQVARVIYRTYIKSDASHPLCLSTPIKRGIVEKLATYSKGSKSSNTCSSNCIDRTLFDDAQSYIKDVLELRFYPLFLSGLQKKLSETNRISCPAKNPYSTTPNFPEDLTRSQSFRCGPVLQNISENCSATLCSPSNNNTQSSALLPATTTADDSVANKSDDQLLTTPPASNPSRQQHQSDTGIPTTTTTSNIPDASLQPQPTDPAVASSTNQLRERQLMATNKPGEFASLLVARLDKVDTKPQPDTCTTTSIYSMPQSPPALTAAHADVTNHHHHHVKDDQAQDILDDHLSRIWSESKPAAKSSNHRRSSSLWRRPGVVRGSSSSSSASSSGVGSVGASSSAARPVARRTSNQRTGSSILSDYDSGLSSTTYDRLPLVNSNNESHSCCCYYRHQQSSKVRLGADPYQEFHPPPASFNLACNHHCIGAATNGHRPSSDHQPCCSYHQGGSLHPRPSSASSRGCRPDRLLDHWIQLQSTSSELSSSPSVSNSKQTSSIHHHRRSKSSKVVTPSVSYSKPVPVPGCDFNMTQSLFCSSSDQNQQSSTSCNNGSSIIVGYYLCDDPVPYRTSWSGQSSNASSTPLTLGLFKQLIAKKGAYRYFFKKPSNEFGTGVVHEELIDDRSIVPLWDGKVFARIERAD